MFTCMIPTCTCTCVLIHCLQEVHQLHDVGRQEISLTEDFQTGIYYIGYLPFQMLAPFTNDITAWVHLHHHAL